MPGADHQLSHAPQPVPARTVIGTHVDKILSSGVFKAADRLRELLRFIVHETMEGRGDELKEYLLAVTVLGRGESFDPKADPIVRIQMRRVREHLDRYYASEGRYDAVHIEIPKGTYMPRFHTAVRRGAVAVPAPIEERIIVGRQKELAALRAAFESAVAGRGQFFCLSGEPGIGKTVLVETFLSELTESTVRCWTGRGRCSERLAGSEAYLPILEALESLVRDGDDAMSQMMDAVAPTWYGQIAPLTRQLTAEPERRAGSQERLKRELVAFLEELARQQPAVIFLDDLHWADASTVDILAYAAPRCASQPILIVGAYRPPELLAADHPLLRVKLELQGQGVCREMPMEFLARADVDRYLALRFPEHRFPRELAARLHERTEGNPLFMADLVRFLAGRSVLAQDEGRWVMRGQLSEVEHELPESVRSMVEKKIGQLTDTDRRLLAAASVQGYEFDAAVVSRALGAEPTDVEERLEVLDRVHSFVTLLGEREFPDRTLTVRYRFVHVLYQNALYASLQPARRTTLSAEVAEALLASSGEQRLAVASELAMLFEAARRFDRAAEFFLMAAEQAAHVAANKEAIVLARRGLAALAMLPETPERAEQELRLQTTLGPALMSTLGWGSPDVEGTYVRARQLCAQMGESPQLFPVMWGLWQYWLARAEYQTARALAEQLLAMGQKLDEPVFLGLAHHSIGNTLWLSGEFESALTHPEQSIAIYSSERHHVAPRYGGHDSGVASRCGVAVVLWLLGYPDRAAQWGQEAITLAREIAHATSIVFALVFDGMIHQHRRDAPQTRMQAETAIALATEQELAPWLAWATALRGWALAEQGEAKEGIDQLRQAIAFFTSGGLRALAPYFRALLADAYAMNGQTTEALTTVTEALAITERTHEGYMEAELYRLKGELLSERAAAEASLHQAIEIARRQNAKSFELRAVVSLSRLLQHDGRRAESRKMLAEIYGWFTEGFDSADLKDARVLLDDLGGFEDDGR